MTSTKDYRDYILEQLSEVPDISYRPMMGEFLLYSNDVLFGGLSAAGDGTGHGHAIIDRDGNVTYLRDAWQEHDDYLIDDARKRDTNTHKI